MNILMNMMKICKNLFTAKYLISINHFKCKFVVCFEAAKFQFNFRSENFCIQLTFHQLTAKLFITLAERHGSVTQKITMTCNNLCNGEDKKIFISFLKSRRPFL